MLAYVGTVPWYCIYEHGSIHPALRAFLDITIDIANITNIATDITNNTTTNITTNTTAIDLPATTTRWNATNVTIVFIFIVVVISVISVVVQRRKSVNVAHDGCWMLGCWD